MSRTAAAATPASMDLKTWAMLLTLGLIWGGSFFFARVAVVHIPPMTLVLFRVVLAAAALHLAFGRMTGFYQTLLSRAPELLLLGIINNAIPFTLIFAGQTVIGAGLASIFNATTPLWTVLIAQMVSEDEKITPAKLAGCALGLAGTVLLIGPAALDHTDTPLWPMLAIIGAAISYGCAANWGKRFRGVPPRIVATGQLTAASLVMLPLALFVDRPWQLPAPPTNALLATIALALLSTAFAYVLFFRILARAGATGTSLVTLLVPPAAILLGVLFLGENLSITEFGGLALIAVGLLTLDNRLRFGRARSA